MGTTAQKLQAVANSKAAIKAAIEAKGVSDVGDVLSTYATKIASIPSGGSSGDPRYEVSEQGALSKKSFVLNYFNNVTSIPSYCLQHAYYQSNVTSVSLPNLTSVGSYGLYYAFYSCTSLTTVDLSSLTRLIGERALYYAFYGCTSLTSVDLSSLTSVSEQNGLANAFNGCTSLTSVSFPSLTSVSGWYGLSSAFYGCTSLTSVDLSSLSSVSYLGLSSTFQGCTSLRNVLLTKLSSVDSAFNNTFNGCTHLELVDFSQATAVPSLSNTNTFQNTNSTFQIVVPDALYSTWIAATNWSTYASHIVKASEYTPAS